MCRPATCLRKWALKGSRSTTAKTSRKQLTTPWRSLGLVNMLVTPFAREVKRLRAEQGLTVRGLASRVGKSTAYIGKIESQGEVPSPDLVREIARVLGANEEQLLTAAKESLLSQYERAVECRYAPEAGTGPGTVAGASGTRQMGEEGAPMATVISLVNMKGGVGKTTLAMQLAHAADNADLKVLAVDLDPQSNLSQTLMGPKKYVAHLQSREPTIVQIFDKYVPTGPDTEAPRRLNVDEVILKKVGYWANSTLDLIPSRLELCRTLKNPTGKERRLAKALAQVQDRYDLVIIDCAPTESILTDAAYFASRYVVAPIKPEFMATIGLPLLARSLREFQIENDDHEISIAGLVFNHSSSYSSGPEGQRSIKEVTDFAKEKGWYVCENQVKYSASYAKSAREGTPIGSTSYVRYTVSEGFRRLKDEIFGAIGLRKVTA